MSDDRQPQKSQETSNHQSETPSPFRTRAYDAFAVQNDKDGNGHFHKIGAAFPHKDGKGFDIAMVATPTNGRITLRTPMERLQETKDAAQPEQRSEHRENGDTHRRRRRRLKKERKLRGYDRY